MFLAVGNINYDYLIYSREPPRVDSRIEAYRFLIEAGGSACNFAVSVVKLGVKCGVLGCVGDDGDWLLNKLRERGVDTSTILKVEGEASGRVFVIVDKNGGRTMIAYKGANRHLEPEVVKSIDIKKYKHVHVSGREASIVEEINMLTREKAEITLSYDPGSTIVRKYPRLVLKSLKRVDYLFVNKEEYDCLLKENRIEDIGEVFEQSDRLKYIFVKRGGAGALALCRDGEISVPAFKVDVVDTTGAGDVFNAGVLVGLKKGLKLRDALLLGNAVAALKITREGAQSSPTLEEVKFFLEERGYGDILSFEG